MHVFDSSFFQLIGRAGRDGAPSCAHVMTNARELKKTNDQDLIKFLSSKENCRRNILIQALGSTENVREPPSRMCCDVCNPRAPMIFERTSTTTRQPRRTIVRVVTKEQQEGLKKALVDEREKITQSNDAYSMLGNELVIPTGCIVEVVRRSQFIQSETDLSAIPGLRRDLVHQMYIVFASFFTDS